MLFNALLTTAAVVLVVGCAAIMYLMARTSLPRARGGSATSRPGKPGWPCRRDYLLLALLITGAAIYGSLVPLEFRPLSLQQAVERFGRVAYLSLGIDGRADFVANILLFIPISYSWLGVLAVDRRRSVLTMFSAAAVVLLCASLSVALEFTQLWFPPRTVSQNDILAETLGSVIGAGLWLVIGQRSTEWCRSSTSSARPKRQIDWLLEAYFIGLVIYSVLPLDLTISVTELVHKYREGKIALVPYMEEGAAFVFLYGLFRDVMIFVPVGMLVATWQTSPERPVRPIPASVLYGGLVVLVIELAQLVVYSRFTATGDVISGTFGVWLGAWGMYRWRKAAPKPRSNGALGGSTKRALVWLALAAVYSLFLFVVFCAPFEPIDDAELITTRYEGFFCVPFARLYRGSEFNAISEVLRKILFCAPLGALLVGAATALPLPTAMRRLLLGFFLAVTAGLAASIEMAQVFLPPHVPDVTDVCLCTAGAALGMFLMPRFSTRDRQ